MVDLERGRYVVPILAAPLEDLIVARRATGVNGRGGGGSGGSGGGGGEDPKNSKVGSTGGGARVRAHYNVHLPDLSLQDEGNSRTLLEVTVLHTLHVHFFCKNFHLFGVFWEDCKHKNLHIPTPPQGWQPPLLGYSKWIGVNDMGACSLASAGRLPHPNPR